MSPTSSTSSTTPAAGVSAVIATRDRPELLRQAIAAVLAQDHPGPVECLVVFDRAEPDHSLELERPGRSVRVVANERADGLAGARNTGLAQARHDLVAFCDDDDLWHPSKLSHQVPVLLAGDAPLVTSGISIDFEGVSTLRVLDRTVVTFSELLRDRHTELHPSTFLARRSTLVELGSVDETLPGGFGEDYDLLLRAARVAPLRHVRLPLTTVRWQGNSYFFRRWDAMSDGLAWIVEHYPELESQPAGAARVRAQVGFAHAAAGRRREAAQWTWSAATRNPREPRVVLAALVALGLPPGLVMERLHRHGRGI